MDKYELTLQEVAEIAEHVATNLGYLIGKDALLLLEIERFCIMKGYKLCKSET